MHWQKKLLFFEKNNEKTSFPSGLQMANVDESVAAAVLLGGGSSGGGYDGMFAVRENDDGTVTVNGCFVDLAPSGPNSPQEISGATLQRPAAAGSASQLFVLLTARIVSGSWQLSFEITDNRRLYTPGEVISWPLARLSTPGKEYYLS